MKTSDPTPPPYVQIMTDIYAWKDLFFSFKKKNQKNMQEAAMHTTMCGRPEEQRRRRKKKRKLNLVLTFEIIRCCGQSLHALRNN